MTDLETKVAVIEIRQDNMEETLRRLDSHMEEISKNLSTISKVFEKYKGIGVAVFVGATAIWGIFSLALTLWVQSRSV